jgi:hypothetical protein
MGFWGGINKMNASYEFGKEKKKKKKRFGQDA